MPRWFWAVAVLLVLGGAAAGYSTVPHYRRPPAGGQARLRERAVQYYRDSSTFDLGAMQRFFTPAHQVGSADKLLKMAQTNRDQTAKAGPETRRHAQLQADAIKAENLTVDIEGDWAVVGGSYTIPGEGKNPSIENEPLEKTVWLRTSGDWWLFLLEADEIACYGNPPDFARPVVDKHPFERQQLRKLQDSSAPAGSQPGPPGKAGAQPAPAPPPAPPSTPRGGASPPASPPSPPPAAGGNSGH